MTAHSAPFGRYRCALCGLLFDCLGHFDRHVEAHGEESPATLAPVAAGGAAE